MANDSLKRNSGQAPSVAFQYRREQVAKQMAGVYLAFGASNTLGTATVSVQQVHIRSSDKRKD